MKIPLKLAIVGLLLITARLSAQNVIIQFNNGTQSAPLISSVQKISFPDDYVLVDLITGDDNLYNIADVRKIYFGNATDNVIPDEDSKLYIFPNPASERITIGNLPLTGIVSIYAIDGSKVYEQNITDSQMIIDIAFLAPGLYLIKTSGSTLKFIRQ